MLEGSTFQYARRRFFRKEASREGRAFPHPAYAGRRSRRWSLAGSGVIWTSRVRERRYKQEENVTSNLISNLYVFMLAAFVGFEVIRRVSPLLHTPLMSLTNALDAIAVVGAIVLVGEHKSTLSTVLGTVAVVAAMSNVVGGFLITDRMLKMFKTSKPKKP
jgi:NAD(P) transhydrogenase subunit alpha